MEWSTTSNLENMRGSLVPLPWLGSTSSFNSLHTFTYDPYAGNSHTLTDTQTGPVISIPESEKTMNAYQFPNNNETIKKKRLTSEQLASLERSFQEDIKLDSDRKLKLSRELGLLPRQIAVWFQNRRARWKAKQLEHLYDTLRQDYDVVSREKHMLHEEVKKLRAILRDHHGVIKKQILAGATEVSGGEDTAEIPLVAIGHSRGNQMYGINNYNNPTMVVSSCWPHYP
ncbi:unnamed protein product [Cochlearia groenlandica]